MKVFAAPNPSKVDSLAFAIRNPYSHPTGSVLALTDLRLFTTSGGKDILEWDIPSGTVKVPIGNFTLILMKLSVSNFIERH